MLELHTERWGAEQMVYFPPSQPHALRKEEGLSCIYNVFIIAPQPSPWPGLK